MTTSAAQKILEVLVIDIGPLIACVDDASVAEVLREGHPVLGEVIAQVRAAAAEWGFFYIHNHGVDEAQMLHFQAAARVLPTARGRQEPAAEVAHQPAGVLRP